MSQSGHPRHRQFKTRRKGRDPQVGAADPGRAGGGWRQQATEPARRAHGGGRRGPREQEDHRSRQLPADRGQVAEDQGVCLPEGAAGAFFLILIKYREKTDGMATATATGRGRGHQGYRAKVPS